MRLQRRTIAWPAALGLTCLGLSSCARKPAPAAAPTAAPAKTVAPKATMPLLSAAFGPNGAIPKAYTCDGKNMSPPLEWSNVPKGCRSLVLICRDPDAPGGNFIHWVIWNLPPTTTSLPENLQPRQILANGARQARNSFGKIGYGGPCPPQGTHRYIWTLYALDEQVNLEGVAPARARAALENHLIAEGQLTGKYRRQ